MILFYSDFIDEAQVFLEEDEFIHCIKVLRHKTGDAIHISNGKGTFAQATIQNISKKSAQLRITESVTHAKSESELILAIAPPKSKNRWELILEKTVELGVDKIIPFYSANSERFRMNDLRAAKIIRSAALQSKRSYHPSISEATSFESLIDSVADQQINKFIAHYTAHNDHLLNEPLSHHVSLIIIGPEGDFRKEEIEYANSNAFKTINLNQNRLRTETAALCAVSILHAKIFQ